MKKRILVLLTIIALFLCLVPTAMAESADVLASGYCGAEGDGTNLTWYLTKDGVLAISGEGEMGGFSYPEKSPWYSHRKSITSVVIGDAVTTIGRDAFKSCENLITVTIPDSVTTIGIEAFYECTSLISVDIPDSVTVIRRHAFANCSSLAAVAISNSLKTIEQSVFSGCTTLASVTIPSSITTIAERAFANCTSLAEIRFEGDAPSFVYEGSLFLYVNATAYYPAGNKTWTEDVTQLYYGGKITWVSYTAIRCDSCTETGTEVTVSAGDDVTGTMVGYIAIYDKDGRFMRAEVMEEQVSSDGRINLSIDYTGEEVQQIGRISVYAIDRDTWVPLCKNWSKTVDFSA